MIVYLSIARLWWYWYWLLIWIYYGKSTLLVHCLYQMSPLNHKRTTSSIAPSVFNVVKNWHLKDWRFAITFTWSIFWWKLTKIEILQFLSILPTNFNSLSIDMSAHLKTLFFSFTASMDNLVIQITKQGLLNLTLPIWSSIPYPNPVDRQLVQSP